MKVREASRGSKSANIKPWGFSVAGGLDLPFAGGAAAATGAEIVFPAARRAAIDRLRGLGMIALRTEGEVLSISVIPVSAGLPSSRVFVVCEWNLTKMPLAPLEPNNMMPPSWL